MLRQENGTSFILLCLKSRSFKFLSFTTVSVKKKPMFDINSLIKKIHDAMIYTISKEQ